MTPKIWGMVGEVKIEKAGRNIFLCKFRTKRLKNRVTKDGPWSFDDALLVFEELKENTSIEDLEFKYVIFWVHFHNVPRVCF